MIRGAVDSLLKSRTAAADVQGLQFVDDNGHTIVEYGRAVAFDARGARIDVATAHDQGVVTLTVPGSWLATAALPIVVDPLLTRVQIATWGAATFGTVQGVDIARDDEAIAANVMIAYTRSASATDADLWLRVCNDDFSADAVVFSDITTSWDTDQVSTCFVGGANRFVAVLRRFFTGTPTLSQLRCKVHDSGSTTLTTNVGFMTPPAGNNEWRADVGGVEGFALGNNALVVFQRENNGAGNNFANVALSEVHASLIDATTLNGTFGATFELQPSATHDSERPSVNQVAAGGTTFSWGLRVPALHRRRDPRGLGSARQADRAERHRVDRHVHLGPRGRRPADPPARSGGRRQERPLRGRVHRRRPGLGRLQDRPDLRQGSLHRALRLGDRQHCPDRRLRAGAAAQQHRPPLGSHRQRL